MAYECSQCGRKLQNPQALKMHLKWKHSLEATKPLNNTNSHQKGGSVLSPLSEPSDDLEIEETEPENPLDVPKEKKGNKCPLCNHELEDFENPCKNCDAIIEWGE